MLIKLALNGKEINLTSDNMTIKSTNFNVDKDGNVILTDDSSSSTYTSFKVSNSNGNRYTILKPWMFDIMNVEHGHSIQTEVTNNVSKIDLKHSSGSNISIQITPDGSSITVGRSGQYTYILEDEIRSQKVTQTSLESIKKNISIYNENALKTILNSDIYTYNLKSEKDTDSKHIGFVIGDKYRTPKEIINNEGNAVELYSAIGILWKAVQELSTRVEQLEKEARDE